MTVESVMNTFTQYVSWLYSERQWAGWELQTITVTALVLLLFLLILRRKARSRKAEINQIERHFSTAGNNLHSDQEAAEFKSNLVNTHALWIPKNNGKNKRWRQTTKKWKKYQKLIEQLQKETALYKQAEQRLERQFTRLKAANEQLRQVIGINSESIQQPDLSRPRTMENGSGQQGRILNTSEVKTKDS